MTNLKKETKTKIKETFSRWKKKLNFLIIYLNKESNIEIETDIRLNEAFFSLKISYLWFFFLCRGQVFSSRSHTPSIDYLNTLYFFLSLSFCVSVSLTLIDYLIIYRVYHHGACYLTFGTRTPPDHSFFIFLSQIGPRRTALESNRAMITNRKNTMKLRYKYWALNVKKNIIDR